MTNPDLRGLQPPPWEERRRFGFINGLVLTIRMVLTDPGRLFRGMPVGTGMLEPLLFAATLAVLGAVFDWMWGLSLGNLPSMFDSRLGQLMHAPGFGMGQFLLSPIIVLIMVFVRAAAFHLMLSLLGGTRLGFEATVRVVAYSRATRLLSVIPFCGSIVGGIWELVVTIIGLVKIHGCPEWKAVVAVLLPVMLGLFLLVGWFVAILGFAMLS